MSNLMPITLRKVEIVNNLNGRGNVLSNDGSCIMLAPGAGSKSVTLYVDLLTDYAVHLVHLRGKAITYPGALVSIRLDGKNLANFSLSREHMVYIKPILTGRVIAVTIVSKIKLCSLEVYTCTIGRTGSNCDQECSDGYFGLSCKKQCKCRNNKPCDKQNGVCPDGCLSGSSGMPEVCYFSKVKVAHRDMFSITKTAAVSINQGPSADLVSSKVDNPSEQCVTLVSQCTSNFLFLELDLIKPIVLYGVEMTFAKFFMPAPFSIYITSNGKPCYGFTSENNSLELGRHVFKCQRRNLMGKYIVVRFSTYNKRTAMNTTGVGINVCKLRALECSSGFYGQHCRQICSCAGNDCDKVTGACVQGKCGLNSRGPYCSSIDVFSNTVAIKMKQYDARSMASHWAARHHPHLSSSSSGYYKWLAVQFDGVYTVNSFTLTLPNVADEKYRSIQVFTDSSMSIANISPVNFSDWPGLPCKVEDPERGLVNYTLTCPGLVKTLFLVIVSDSVFLDVSSATIKMWSCVDGMFGAECEHTCNCNNISESCDKIRGSCLSGCAQGYKGSNCSQVCQENDPDPTCLTQPCHCLGEDRSDCGPGVALCAQGCQAGWMGVSCSLPCPMGFFGSGCEEECGNCRYNESTDIGTRTCVPTNGTCWLGCTDPTDESPTCSNGRRSRATIRVTRPLRPWMEKEAAREAHYWMKIEDSSVQVVLGLVAVISACSTLVILVCCSLKCYWDRIARNKRLNEKRVELMVRRAINSKVDNKIQSEHQQFHEAFLKRDIMKKLGEKHQEKSKVRAKAKAEAIRLMILEMENQRRLHKIKDEEEEEEEDEQDPDQKVALWILSQNFKELIDRRKKRLHEFTGNIIEMEESPYRISEVSEITDIHALYDDLEHLGIP